jgi:hypothetical protein
MVCRIRGNGGKDRTENKRDVLGAGQSAPPEVYYISCYIPKGSTL